MFLPKNNINSLYLSSYKSIYWFNLPFFLLNILRVAAFVFSRNLCGCGPCPSTLASISVLALRGLIISVLFGKYVVIFESSMSSIRTVPLSPGALILPILPAQSFQNEAWLFVIAFASSSPGYSLMTTNFPDKLSSGSGSGSGCDLVVEAGSAANLLGRLLASSHFSAHYLAIDWPRSWYVML